MEKLKLDLNDCYGIKKFKTEIDYTKTNVAVIYAPNGTMKTSLAKTFTDISNNAQVEERIFGRKSKYKIVDENDNDIDSKQIIVLNPSDSENCDNQGLLMANENLRKEYVKIYKDIEDKKKDLYNNIKKSLHYSSRNNFDVASAMLRDWHKSKNEEYLCLEEIKSYLHSDEMCCSLEADELQYETLFNEKIYSVIKTPQTVLLIEDYEKKYKKLVKESQFFKEGTIDHNNYLKINESLDKNNYFKVHNELILRSKDGLESKTIKSVKELSDFINSEKKAVLNTSEMKDAFEKVNTAIRKNANTQKFDDFLKNHQDIIIEYKDLELFKKKVWILAFSNHEELLNDVLCQYSQAKIKLKELRDKAKQETTEWQLALHLFKNRFYVPFDIESSNQEDVILNLELPSFNYIFRESGDCKQVSRNDLLSVLSTGEKRAYNILNMIFKLLVAKKQGNEHLIVMDDISESFDYKNKYAIIEYIKDISELNNSNGSKQFKILLLTHNFDFYRTVSSRLSIKRNAFIAYTSDEEIKMSQGNYTGNIFGFFRKKINKDNKYVIASIPFVRNLIEYTEGIENKDYKLLTSLLHHKDDTDEITIKEVEDIFNRYWCKNKNVEFAKNREKDKMSSLIISEANNITDEEKLEIENKLILSMAIRLKAEKYMKEKIIEVNADASEIIKEISSNQTAKLLTKYKENITDENIDILELVSMMTPENIHLNSFMYEPILDMSVKQLYDLYQKVKQMEN